MAVEFETLGPSKDQKGELAQTPQVEEFLRDQIVLRRFGLLFGLNRDQGVVIDNGLHALSPEMMEEIGLRIMRDVGCLIEESGQTREDYTNLDKGEKKDDVTIFRGRNADFEKRVCIDLEGTPFRVRWFLRASQTEIPR